MVISPEIKEELYYEKKGVGMHDGFDGSHRSRISVRL
jgi:hypothetical protein